MALRPHHQTLTPTGLSKDGLVCRPLDTFSDITWFIEQPPAWRTLCKELTPHSKNKLKNIELINRNISDISPEEPDTFCHYDPDAEDVLRYDENTLPKTLVCHDMANGYHDDSYIEGTTNYEGYTFYNWAAIDIFCYFSHHFITIPPVSWINVAHEHGVKVIGTVITEWNEGVSLWDKILSSESESTTFAGTLVTIASTLKFDGWLMNVENKINSPDKLLDFLTILHRMLHKELENATLIWYDSVTVKGNLNWQNGLNEKNKAFFDVCDGIFTNYSWEQADLQGSVRAAGARVRDLYVGVDVWGRNFYGGGQLNTQQAVSMIHKYGCSMALFAPAWTYETLSTDPLDVNGITMSEGLDKCAQWHLRDRALWGSLWAFLNTRVPSRLPFRTSFCRGMGRQRRMYGEVLCNAPWYNLRHQQYQPNSAHGPHGYLITSFELILHHAQHYKELHQKGILRYRESFQSALCLKNIDCKELDAAEWIIREGGSLINPNSVSDEDRKHGPGGADDSKHLHGLPNDDNDECKKVALSERSSSDSDQSGKKKNPQRTGSGSTILQSVKKVLMKLTHHKSLSELAQADRLSQAQARLTQSSAESPGQSSPQDSLTEASKTCPDHSSDQKSAVNQLDNDDEDEKTSKTLYNNHLESQHSEDTGGVQHKHSTDEVNELEPLSAGPSGGGGGAAGREGRALHQTSVSIRLGARDRRAYGLTRVPGETECLEFCLEDSFNGGACLRINPSDESSSAHHYSRLFHCDFLCGPDVLVCVVTKAQPASTQTLNILLKMRNPSGAPLSVWLVGRARPAGRAQSPAAPRPLAVSPLDEPALAALRRALLVQHPACYVPTHNDFGWRVRYYHLTLGGCRVTAVCCHALMSNEPILLGHFAIVPLEMNSSTVD